MTTKAQLEAELADLKQQLADRDRVQAKADTAPEASEQPDADASDADIGQAIGEMIARLEDLPARQQLLVALGAFAFGYLLGRSR